jgi:hypothetical protein
MSRAVVVYFSEPSAGLRAHEKATLFDVAAMIADLNGWKRTGSYVSETQYSAQPFFVPDDVLLAAEALKLGIRTQSDLFGGVVPYPVAKTKAITHQLVNSSANRPAGWPSAFAKKVRAAVLLGSTAFSVSDARLAAVQLLKHGTIRVKLASGAGGKGQTVISNEHDLDSLLERLPGGEIAAHGLVIEENLRHVTTLSVGQVTINRMMIAYHGRQRTVVDNDGRPVYGGSHLVCVRGGWQALNNLPMTPALHFAIAQARMYDDAADAHLGLLSSRRNYDVGQGFDSTGQWRSGVFEASWRPGGASTAELAALTAFARDRSLQVFEVSTAKEFGRDRKATPRYATIHFAGDDPEDGPIVRYTIATRTLSKAA